MDLQEGDSLTALKAILAKVATLLRPLQLTQDESIRLVEQLYGSVLDMDVKLAGESDETRKSQMLVSHPERGGPARSRPARGGLPAGPTPALRARRSGSGPAPVRRHRRSRTTSRAGRPAGPHVPARPGCPTRPCRPAGCHGPEGPTAQRDTTSTRAPAAPPVREGGPANTRAPMKRIERSSRRSVPGLTRPLKPCDGVASREPPPRRSRSHNPAPTATAVSPGRAARAVARCSR